MDPLDCSAPGCDQAAVVQVVLARLFNQRQRVIGPGVFCGKHGSEMALGEERRAVVLSWSGDGAK